MRTPYWKTSEQAQLLALAMVHVGLSMAWLFYFAFEQTVLWPRALLAPIPILLLQMVIIQWVNHHFEHRNQIIWDWRWPWQGREHPSDSLWLMRKLYWPMWHVCRFLYRLLCKVGRYGWARRIDDWSWICDRRSYTHKQWVETSAIAGRLIDEILAEEREAKLQTQQEN